MNVAKADAVPPALPVRPRPALVTAIKVVHTLAWASIESCVLYVLYAGFAGRTDKRVGIAGAIVAGETLLVLRTYLHARNLRRSYSANPITAQRRTT